jgi:hypothetical protein
MPKTILAITGLAVAALVVLLIAVGCTARDSDADYYPHGYYPINQPHPGATGYRTGPPRTTGTTPKTSVRKPIGTALRPAYRPGSGRR